MKIQNYKLELYKPSGEYRGELIVDNLSADIKFNDISSISFEIPTYINGQANPRIAEVLDTYEVVLSYGDLSLPKMRFVLYETPVSFEEYKYSHRYSGYSTESKLEQRQIVSWPGIEKSRSYFIAKPGEEGFSIVTGTPNYILFDINGSVSDETLEIFEVRQSSDISNESPLIPYDSGSALDFSRGYYERVSSTSLKIALDSTATYNDMIANLTDYYFKVYDNPANTSPTIIYSALDESSGSRPYATETVQPMNTVTETIIGRTYQSERYFSKDGLKLSQVLKDLLLDSGFTSEIESSVDELFRSNLEYNNISIYQAIKSAAESFKAVLITDTVDKKLYFYPDLVYGENNGLSIQYGTYLKSIQKEIDTTKIVTKTRGLGKDNLGITLITPTQDGYWEDYSYYLDEFLIEAGQYTLSNANDITTVSISNMANLSSRWMSRSLAEKIAKWQFIRNYYHAVFNGETSYLGLTIPLVSDADYAGIYLNRKNYIESVVLQETQRDSAYAQELKYKYLKEHYENLLANDLTNTSYIEQKNRYTNSFNQYHAEVAAKNIKIANLEVLINSIGTAIILVNKNKLSKNLNTNEQNELKNFVKEYIFSDSSYGNDYDLLIGVLEYVEENKYPKVTISTGIIDILAAQETQADKNKINIGDKINIYFEEFNIDLEAQIKEISINFDQNSINLTISTTRHYNKGVMNSFASILRRVNDSNKNILKYSNDANKHSFENSIEVEKVLTNGIFTQNTTINAGMTTAAGVNPITIDTDGLTSSEIQVDPYTETISVLSGSKVIKFTNGSIIIKDGTNKHIEMSVDNGFTIINNLGIKTFYVDLNGNAVFNGILSVTSTEDIYEAIGQAELDAISTANLYAANLAADLQLQIDNAITTWFGDGVPLPTNFDYTTPDPDHATNNTPTEDWPTPMTIEYLQLHVGDLYYDNLTGYAFRLSVVSGGSPNVIADYKWVVITDSAVIAALEAASMAQETADGKMTIYYINTADTDISGITPEEGDLLVVSSNYTGTTYIKNETYRRTGSIWTKNQNIENKDSGTVAGWNISSSAIFSGLSTRTPAANNTFDTVGMTLGATGYISAKEFKINSAGDATFRGTLDAAYGTFGNVSISPSGYLRAGSTAGLDFSGGNLNNSGFFLNTDGRFTAGNKDNFIKWDNTKLELIGDIGGTVGLINIGNIDISQEGIRAYIDPLDKINTTTFFLDSLYGNATFSGTINSSSGVVGGWNLNSNKLYFGSLDSPTALIGPSTIQFKQEYSNLPIYNVDFATLTNNIVGSSGTALILERFESVYSATSSTLSVGSRTFSISGASPVLLGWSVGISLRVSLSTDQSLWMIGNVTARDSMTVTINITSVSGSGSYSGWYIRLLNDNGIVKKVTLNPEGLFTYGPPGKINEPFILETNTVFKIRNTYSTSLARNGIVITTNDNVGSNSGGNIVLDSGIHLTQILGKVSLNSLGVAKRMYGLSSAFYGPTQDIVWTNSTFYAAGAIVIIGGSQQTATRYICKSAHTSSSLTMPGSGANWTVYWAIPDLNNFIELTAHDGYILKIAWGRKILSSGTASEIFTLPVSYQNTSYSVFASVYSSDSSGSGADAAYAKVVTNHSISLTKDFSTTNNSNEISWMTIGW